MFLKISQLEISPYHYKYIPPCRYIPRLVFWDFEILKKIDRTWQRNSTFCCWSHRKWRKIFFISSSIIFLFAIRGTKNIISIWNGILFQWFHCRFDNNINYTWWFQLNFSTSILPIYIQQNITARRRRRSVYVFTRGVWGAEPPNKFHTFSIVGDEY